MLGQTMANRHSFHTPFSVHSIMTLKREDRVDLFMEEGELGSENKDDNHSIQWKLLFPEDVKVKKKLFLMINTNVLNAFLKIN